MPTQLHSIDIVEVTKDVGSISSNSTQEVEFTVPGVRADDYVLASKPSLDAGLLTGSTRVSDDDTVQVQFVNATAGSVDPGEETYRFFVFRPYDSDHSSVHP